MVVRPRIDLVAQERRGELRQLETGGVEVPIRIENTQLTDFA